MGLTAGADNTSCCVVDLVHSGLDRRTGASPAYYSGDSNYTAERPITTTDECFDVTAVPSSTTSTSCRTRASSLGNSNSDRAVVTGDASSGPRPGRVTFYECGPTPPHRMHLSDEPGGKRSDRATAGAGNTSSASRSSFTPHRGGYWCFAGLLLG